MDEEGSSGADALEEPSVADALVSSYGSVEAGSAPPAEDAPRGAPTEDPAPAAVSESPDELTAPTTSPPPRPDAPETVAGGQPGPSKRVRGVARRPWLAALLNASGLGAGYAYLRRWIRWGVYLVLLVTLGILAWQGDGASQPALWLGPAAVLVVASIVDAWVAARTSVRRAGGVAVGRPAVALAVAVVLLAVVAGGALAYRAAGDSSYQIGLSAMAKGDCAAAIDRFRSVTTVYELTFSSDVAQADAGIEDCRAFQAAENIQGGGDHEAAVAAFRSFEEANPDSALVPVARDRQAATFVSWGGELVAAGDFQEGIDRFETVARELADSEPATEAHEAEGAAYTSWGDALAAEGNFEEAVAKYDVADEEFADTSAADGAHEAAAATYVAWGERLVANQDWAPAIEKYAAASAEYEGTPAANDARVALDDLFQSALDDIDTVRACIAREKLDGFVQAELEAKRARNNLAPALYQCGLTQRDVVNYELALAQFDRLLEDFPNSQLIDETKVAVIDTRVLEYLAGEHLDFGAPQRIGSAPSGTVLVEYQNDSPVGQELLLSGPTTTSIVLEPCTSCVKYEEGSEPAYCPEKGPKTTVTLVPGRYSIAAVSTSDPTIEAAADTWTLTSGSKYYACVIIFANPG